MTRRLVPALFLAAAVPLCIHAGRAVGVAFSHATLSAVLIAVYYVLRGAVALAFAAFTINRAEPHRHARGFVPFVACAAAMGAVLAFEAPSAATPVRFVLAGDLVAVVSGVWLLIAVLSLGRCFGVLPEARGLVTGGPYRFVRHPVYLGEIGAFIGLALAAPTVVNIPVLAVVIAAQLVRMRLEERALTRAFGDEYRRYAARTPRLIPRLVRSRSGYRRGSEPVSGGGVATAGPLPPAPPQPAPALFAASAMTVASPPLSRTPPDGAGNWNT